MALTPLAPRSNPAPVQDRREAPTKTAEAPTTARPSTAATKTATTKTTATTTAATTTEAAPRRPTEASARDARTAAALDPQVRLRQAQLSARLDAQAAPSTPKVQAKSRNSESTRFLDDIVTFGRGAPQVIDQLGPEGSAAFRRLSDAADHDPATNPQAAKDWTTTLAAARVNVSPGGAWATNPDLKAGVDALAHHVQAAQPAPPSLKQVLGDLATAPPALIDQLGPDGAAALRRLTAGQKTDFSDKATATDWSTVLRAATTAVETGPWRGSEDARRVVDAVKPQVIDGLVARGKDQPPYTSPRVAETFHKMNRLSGNWGNNLKKQLGEHPEWNDEERARLVGFVIGNHSGLAYGGLNEQEKNLMFGYLTSRDRDAPTTQARLELSVNPRALTDIDFPAVLTPPLTLGRGSGDLAVSLAPSTPTANGYFSFSNDPKYAFDGGQRAEISQALETFRTSDPVAWAQISKLVGATGQIEIRNNDDGGSHTDFLANGQPALLLDYRDPANVLFKATDGSVARFGMSEVVWHELEHFGQLGEYGLFDRAAVHEALGGNSPSDVLQLHFENEATARTNTIHQQHGKPLRATYEQTLDIRDFGGGGDGLRKATDVLAAQPTILGSWTAEYASATGRPEVLWTDGNSSLLSYLPHDPGAGLSGTLSFTGSNGSLVFL